MGRPTLADVARLAGVSAKSASRVINDHPSVSAALRSEVENAIRTLGYRPDRRARTLASGPRSQLVGYVQADAAHSFFAGVLRGLDDAVRETGHLVVTGSTDTLPEREHELVEALLEMRVDGLVIAGTVGDDDIVRREAAAGTPIVCVDRVGEGIDCDTVVSDNRGGVEQAVGHLWELGHRSIAFLGGLEGLWVADERLAGFRSAMAARGVQSDPELVVTGLLDGDEAEKAAGRLLSGSAPPPSAIVTGGAEFTVATIRVLQSRHLSTDVALIGFDDVAHAEQVRPSVSVVAQDPHGMGRAAGLLLLGRLADPTRPSRRVVVPCNFVSRASAWIPAPG